MRIKLQNVRIAFCADLFKAGHFQGDTSSKPSYSATFLILKSDTKQLKMLQDAIKSEAQGKWGAKAEKILKDLMSKDRTCLHDGETKDYEGFQDAMYVAARSTVKPGVFDQAREPIAESSGEMYAGCYVNASIDVYAQDNQWGKRINASLRGVQKVKDGDAFAGGTPASADEFDDIADTGDEDDLTA